MNAMMVQSDLYIRGSEAQRDAIVQMVMEVLVGDPMHLGLLVGLNTEDPECVVVRVELPDASALVTLRDALLECFDDIDIEVDEDVADVPWPFE